MQTRREYLASKGLATIGRGRFSADAKAELDRVRAEGMKFSDDPEFKVEKPKREPKPVKETKPAKEVKPSAKDAVYARPDWTTMQYIEFEAPAGKVYFKTPCINCGYSVSNCRCSDPSVWAGKFMNVKCGLVNR